MQDCSTPHIDKDAALLRLSSHLGELAQQVLRLEDAVGAVHAGARKMDGQAITHLQSLDFVRQSLEDMEHAIKLIAHQDPEGPQCCLGCRANTLKLASSRLALLGEDAGDDIHLSGDFDLF